MAKEDKYYVNAAGVSLMVNRMISSCMLHSENPTRNALYLLERLSRLPADAIQTDEDYVIVIGMLQKCIKQLADIEAELTSARFAEQQLKKAAE